MQVAFTIVCPPDQQCVGGVRFNVDAVRGAQRETLLKTRILFNGPAAWQTRVIPLAAERDTPVTVELTVAPYGPTGTPPRQLPIGLWAEPLIIGEATRRRPNLLLISLDTLRADHLGSYGYTRPTSPTLDRFAAEGVRFAQAMSQSPWTTPAHMSLFTSLYPTAHQVNRSVRRTIKIMAGKDRQHALAQSVTTLPELLRANGYHTLALTGGATMTGVLGFAQGFDVYREDATKLTRDVGVTLGNWINTFGRDPFFLFLHTFEVHTPYTRLTFAAPLLSDDQRAELLALVRPRPAHEWFDLNNQLMTYLREHGLFRREVTEALYDGGIRAADDFLAGLFTSLQHRGLYDETLIIIFSDHGEELGEHNPEHIYGIHGTSMYDLMIRVPLLMRLPGRLRAGTVVEQQIELIDVAPTVLDLLGMAAPRTMQGTSLTPLIDGATGRAKDWALSEATSEGDELKSLRTEDFKYVMAGQVRDGNRSGVPPVIKREMLYDLRADPDERQPIVDRERMTAMRARLEALLRSIPAGAQPAEQAFLDPDVSERLRALGYAQ
jgi:arylsulfatase A-like enzyme